MDATSIKDSSGVSSVNVCQPLLELFSYVARTELSQDKVTHRSDTL